MERGGWPFILSKLLLLLSMDYEYFIGGNDHDVIDQINEDDKKEFAFMLGEPFAHDTISQNELNELIVQWRMK